MVCKQFVLPFSQVPAIYPSNLPSSQLVFGSKNFTLTLVLEHSTFRSVFLNPFPSRSYADSHYEEFLDILLRSRRIFSQLPLLVALLDSPLGHPLP